MAFSQLSVGYDTQSQTSCTEPKKEMEGDVWIGVGLAGDWA